MLNLHKTIRTAIYFYEHINAKSFFLLKQNSGALIMLVKYLNTSRRKNNSSVNYLQKENLIQYSYVSDYFYLSISVQTKQFHIKITTMMGFMLSSMYILLSYSISNSFPY